MANLTVSYTIPPRLTSIIDERNRICPNARGAPGAHGVPSSDGTIGDQSHQAQGSGSDHNPDARGIVHAVDISQSMPGSPYWDGRCGEFDIFAQFHRIIAEYSALDAAGRQRRYGWLRYLVWYEASIGGEAIWNPTVSLLIRRNGNNQGHREHGHISINHNAVSENDTQPIFSAAPTTPAPPLIKVKPVIDTKSPLRDVKEVHFPHKDGTPARVKAVALTRDGGIFIPKPGAGFTPFTPVGQDYWEGQFAAALAVKGDPDNPLTAAEVKAGKLYAVIAESGNRYAYGPKKP